jgi:uncharacterized membrane protein YraQ (UPF0718 family)
MNKQKRNKSPKKGNNSRIILIIAIVMYIVTFLINKETFVKAINDFLELIIKVIPILIVVFALMIVSNIYITNQMIKKWFTKTKGIKGWVLIVIAGFISAGPPYLWYPLLADMKSKGMKEGFIACFIYTRAIKPYFLPVLILYFGVKYTITLSFVMIIMGVILGIIMNSVKLQNFMKKEGV